MPTVKATAGAVAKRKTQLSNAEKAGFAKQLRTTDKKWQKRFDRDQERAFDSSMTNRLFRSVANDIHPLPEVAYPARREACRLDLALACKTYFPNKFRLDWSQDHLQLIGVIQDSILRGAGTAAAALPRGQGKTTIAECAGLWALFYGHKQYMLLICASSSAARDMFRSLQTEIETNELLLEDFPEAVYPIQQLRGSYFRAKFQHLNGEPTRIVLSSELIMLPHIEGSVCSNSIIQCASLTGRIRGMKQTLANGDAVRPDYVIIDDPQTDKSAKSPVMTNQREKIILGTILGLAGPQKPLSVVMPCTVIAKDDLSERFLNRDKRPQWQGQRTKLLPSMPKNMELWQQYNQVRAESLRAGNHGIEATAFYRDNREAMDAGAVVSWTERYNPPLQASAVQFAMDLYFDDPVTFAAEYQNEPLIESMDDSQRLMIDATAVLERYSGMRSLVVPRDTFHITSGVDIQGRLIYYLTVAWREDFGGTIVDYGCWPKQPLDYFVAGNPPVSFADVDELREMTLAPQVYAALQHIHASVIGREFIRDEVGGIEKVEKCGIDANWSQVTDAVYAFCKEHEASGLYHPLHGKGITAGGLPMHDWTTKIGEKRGTQPWIQKFGTAANRGRHITFDTNWWKSLVAERLIAPKGNRNALLISGNYSPRHQLLADHLASEKPEKTFGRGRHVDEWKMKPGRDNHWWDCLVQAAVMANFAGLAPHDIVKRADDGDESTAPAPKKERRVVQMGTPR